MGVGAYVAALVTIPPAIRAALAPSLPGFIADNTVPFVPAVLLGGRGRRSRRRRGRPRAHAHAGERDGDGHDRHARDPVRRLRQLGRHHARRDRAVRHPALDDGLVGAGLRRGRDRDLPGLPRVAGGTEAAREPDRLARRRGARRRRRAAALVGVGAVRRDDGRRRRRSGRSTTSRSARASSSSRRRSPCSRCSSSAASARFPAPSSAPWR